MKNLGTLFGYEMKKLWRRPMAWIALILFSGGFVYYSAIPFYNYYGHTYTYTMPNGEVLSRAYTQEEQARFMLEAPRLLSGQPMDEEFFAKAEEHIPARLEDSDTTDREELRRFVENQEQRDGYFFLVDPTWYGAYKTLVFKDWYLHRQDRIKWEFEQEWNHFTQEETAYWMQLEEQIQQPFIYEPTDGPNRLFDVLGTMGFFVSVLVALCVCELFSQERRAGTYPQIFSSRQGRGCLYLAKILAGSATSVLATAIGVGAVIAASLIRYGPWGWGAAIQLCLYVHSCSFPITARQGILMLVALVLVYALLCGAIISVVSMWSGSGVAALAVSAGLVGAQLLLLQQMWILEMILGAVPVLQEALAYLPVALVNAGLLTQKKLTHFFGLTLNYLQAGVLVYLAVSVLLAAACWLGWRRKAVGRV